jgi:hypothetical protein
LPGVYIVERYGRDDSDEGAPMSIRQQTMILADPAKVYAVLSDAAALSALSGMGEDGGRSEGDGFSA